MLFFILFFSFHIHFAILSIREAAKEEFLFVCFKMLLDEGLLVVKLFEKVVFLMFD